MILGALHRDRGGLEVLRRADQQHDSGGSLHGHARSGTRRPGPGCNRRFQWPAMARSNDIGGRSQIDTMSLSMPGMPCCLGGRFQTAAEGKLRAVCTPLPISFGLGPSPRPNFLEAMIGSRDASRTVSPLRLRRRSVCAGWSPKPQSRAMRGFGATATSAKAPIGTIERSSTSRAESQTATGSS